MCVCRSDSSRHGRKSKSGDKTDMDLGDVLDRYDTDSFMLYQTHRLNFRGLAQYLCMLWDGKPEDEVRTLLERLFKKVRKPHAASCDTLQHRLTLRSQQPQHRETTTRNSPKSG